MHEKEIAQLKKEIEKLVNDGNVEIIKKQGQIELYQKMGEDDQKTDKGTGQTSEPKGAK